MYLQVKARIWKEVQDKQRIIFITRHNKKQENMTLNAWVYVMRPDGQHRLFIRLTFKGNF